MTVSVVVPSRGGVRRLPRLLSALATQTSTDFETIVVVDGDMDGTEEYLRGDLHVAVRSIVLPANQGRSAALNAGFDAARGDVLVRCDDDLVPPPGWVAGHHERHSTPGVGAGVGVGVIGVCRNLIDDNPYARAYGRDANARLLAASYAAAPEVRWRFWGGNVSVDAETWRAIGPYDTGFRGYGWEDVDWGYRLHATGAPLVIAPELEVVHHVAADSARARALRAFWSGAARTRFEAKHGRPDAEAAEEGGLWNTAVSRAAGHLDEGGVRRWGDRIDASLPRLPAPVGRKAVALLVESAFAAGYARPASVGSTL